MSKACGKTRAAMSKAAWQDPGGDVGLAAPCPTGTTSMIISADT